MDRLNSLCYVHTILVETGKLKKTDRPYSLSSRLDTIQKLIMEEIEKGKQSTPPKSDDIPF